MRTLFDSLPLFAVALRFERLGICHDGEDRIVETEITERQKTGIDGDETKSLIIKIVRCQSRLNERTFDCLSSRRARARSDHRNDGSTIDRREDEDDRSNKRGLSSSNLLIGPSS